MQAVPGERHVARGLGGHVCVKMNTGLGRRDQGAPPVLEVKHL